MIVKGTYLNENFINPHTDELINRYPVLASVRESFTEGYKVILSTYEHNGKLLVAGNGGSAADAEHIAGELMKRFRLPRPRDPQLCEMLVSIDPIRGKSLA